MIRMRVLSLLLLSLSAAAALHGWASHFDTSRCGAPSALPPVRHGSPTEESPPHDMTTFVVD